MARWIIRTAEGAYLDTLEAANQVKASARAFALYSVYGRLTVRSAVSEQLTADEELILKRNEIQRNEHMSTMEKRREWEQAIQEYRQRQREVAF